MLGGFGNIFGGGASGGDIVSYVGVAGVDRSLAELQRFGRGMDGIARRTNAAGRAVSRTATLITGALAGITVASGKMAADYEANMANVFTLLDISEQQFSNMSAGLLDVSARVGEAAPKLAGALYDVVSAGIDAGKALDVVELSARAAAAGVTDTKTAVRAGLSVLNAYGLEASELTRIYNIQFKTIKKGVITFQQYASAIGTVLPAAATLGARLEGVNAAIATLTKGGISPDIATTFLSRALNSFVEQRKQYEALGVQIFDDAGKFRGIIPVVDELAKALSGLTDKQRNLVLETLKMDARADKAIKTLAKMMDTTGGLRDTYNEMVSSSGALDAAFQKIEQTVEHQFKVLSASAQATMIAMGEELLPVLKDIAVETRDWVAEARKSGELKELGQKLAAGLREVWKYTKLIGGFVAEHGDVLLYGFGALVAGKIVGKAFAFARGIAAIAGKVKALNATLAGGLALKLLGGVGLAVGAGVAAGEARYGDLIEAARAATEASRAQAEALQNDIDVIKKAGREGLALFRRWKEAEEVAFDAADLESRIRPYAEEFQKLGNVKVLFGSGFMDVITDEGRMPLMEYLKMLGARVKALRGDVEKPVTTPPAPAGNAGGGKVPKTGFDAAKEARYQAEQYAQAQEYLWQRGQEKVREAQGWLADAYARNLEGLDALSESSLEKAIGTAEALLAVWGDNADRRMELEARIAEYKVMLADEELARQRQLAAELYQVIGRPFEGLLASITDATRTGKQKWDAFFRDLRGTVIRFLASMAVQRLMAFLAGLIVPGGSLAAQATAAAVGAVSGIPSNSRGGYVPPSAHGELRRVGENNTPELIIPVAQMENFLEGRYALDGRYRAERFFPDVTSGAVPGPKVSGGREASAPREQRVKVVVETVAPDLARVRQHYVEVNRSINRPDNDYVENSLRTEAGEFD